MLSITILEKNKKKDLDQTDSTIPDSPIDGDNEREKKLKEIHTEICDFANKILSGQLNNNFSEEQQNPADEMGPPGMGAGLGQMGGPGMGGPGMGGPGMGGMGYVKPYATKMEAFKARFKMFGLFLIHIGGLLLLRRFSYKFSR